MTTGIVPLTTTSGKYVYTNTDPVDITDIRTYSIMQYCVESCVEGNVFVINGQGNTNGRLWTFVKSEQL